MSDEQNKELVDETQAASTPTDIAEAFKMYNQANRAAAEEPLASGETGDAVSSENNNEGSVSTEPDGTGNIASDTIGNIEEDTGGSLGGSTTLVEPVDYSPAKQEVLKNIQNRAVDEVRKELKEQQIDLWSITDIRIEEKDRDGNPTGRILYRNPDDPDHPFSNRADAQAYITSINDEIQNLFRRRVNEKQQELLQQSLPTLQMMDFAPTYQGMSQIEKDVFDDLVAPYAINDGQGNIIGFNVNLDSVANTAKQVAKRFASQQPAAQQPAQNQEQTKQQGSRPAMDIKSGNGVSPDEEEPKTIGEALKRVDEANRKKKEGK